MPRIPRNPTNTIEGCTLQAQRCVRYSLYSPGIPSRLARLPLPLSIVLSSFPRDLQGPPDASASASGGRREHVNTTPPLPFTEKTKKKTNNMEILHYHTQQMTNEMKWLLPSLSCTKHELNKKRKTCFFFPFCFVYLYIYDY